MTRPPQPGALQELIKSLRHGFADAQHAITLPLTSCFAGPDHNEVPDATGKPSFLADAPDILTFTKLTYARSKPRHSSNTSLMPAGASPYFSTSFSTWMRLSPRRAASWSRGRATGKGQALLMTWILTKERPTSSRHPAGASTISVFVDILALQLSRWGLMLAAF